MKEDFDLSAAAAHSQVTLSRINLGSWTGPSSSSTQSCQVPGQGHDEVGNGESSVCAVLTFEKDTS